MDDTTRARLKDAVRWGKEDVVREIVSSVNGSEAFSEWKGLKTPVDKAGTGEDKENVILIAADLGRVPIMQLLADHGADLNDFYSGITPLMRACKCNRIELAEYLLSQGVDPFLRDHLHQTAVAYASMGGAATILRSLLALNTIDINEKNGYGMTFLMLAANNGHTHCAEALLDAGANVDERIYPNRVGSVHNPAQTSLDGRTALHFAAYLNQISVIKVLIAHGANRTIRDGGGCTAYQLASKECQREAFGMPVKGEAGICVVS